MSPQQRADQDLAIWQSHRDLTPVERMEHLVREFMKPAKDGYAKTLERVEQEMLSL